MEAHLQKTVDDLLAKLKELEREAADTKRTINGLCALGKVDPMFPVVEVEQVAVTSIKSDTFYGQPFATAATTYLRMRKAMNMGPASVAEIYEALKSGGYQFDATNEDYAKRGVRHSLTKNTQTFHKLPNGDFGLIEWYPAIKKTKPAKNGASGDHGRGGSENGDEGDADLGEDDDEKNGDSQDDEEPDFGGFGGFGGDPPAAEVPAAPVTTPDPPSEPTTKVKTTRKSASE